MPSGGKGMMREESRLWQQGRCKNVSEEEISGESRCTTDKLERVFRPACRATLRTDQPTARARQKTDQKYPGGEAAIRQKGKYRQSTGSAISSYKVSLGVNIYYLLCPKVLPGVTDMLPGVTRCDQLWPSVTSCCFSSIGKWKHVFGHISPLGDVLWLKIHENDGVDVLVQHVKFGGDSWPYKIVTAPNVPD